MVRHLRLFCSSALILLWSAGFGGLPAFAASAAGTEPSAAAAPSSSVEKGWFFYDDPVKQQEVEQDLVTAVTPPAELPPDAPKPDKCKQARSWTAACGFVDPGKDFAWQSAERDALLQQMIMAPADQAGVEAFQRYNKWVIDKALLAAKTWQWNTVQHPDLDPRVSTPINDTGLMVAENLKNTRAKDIFQYIAKSGGMVFYFTRSDCSYCHDMASVAHDLARDGLPVYNATISGDCVAGFDAQHCLPASESYGPAGVLQVTVVPAVILYMPSNTWIRLATGFTTTQHIEDRLVNFFTAWKTAVAKGLSGQNGTAPVDFDPAHTPALGVAIGAGVGDTKLPTESDIKSILFSN